MALANGSTFGPYQIIEPLGRGGMASVYKAYEPALDRYVALKVLPFEAGQDETFAERFRREAKVIARLEHPNIIPIHNFGIDAKTQTPWMAMRLISGGALSGFLKGNRLSLDRTLWILRGVSDALDYAHGKGVVHRDVKPQNILLDEADRVYLADFGIARMVEGGPALTAVGLISGTPQYMAPEQATAQTVDHRADVYALGVVAYEMLTGRVPFSADTPVAVLMKHVQDPIPIPSPEEVPEPLVRGILKCMAKKPEDRWASAGEFARMLQHSAGSLPTVPGTPAISATMTTALPWSVSTGQGTAANVGATVQSTYSSTAPPARRFTSGTALTPVGVGSGAGGRPATGGRPILVIAGVGAALFAVVALVGSWLILNRTGTPSPSPTARATPLANAAPPLGSTPSEAPAPDAPPLQPVASLPPPVPSLVPPTPAPSARPFARPTPSPSVRTASATVAPPVAPIPTVIPPTPAPLARGTLRIDVDAVQRPFGDNIPSLKLQVLVDGRPVKEFALAFEGKDAFSRSRRRQTFEVPGIPVGTRRIGLVATGGGEQVEGSAEMPITEGQNRAAVQIRLMGRTDRGVRFR